MKPHVAFIKGGRWGGGGGGGMVVQGELGAHLGVRGEGRCEKIPFLSPHEHSNTLTNHT
jgi:hypothetical protein